MTKLSFWNSILVLFGPCVPKEFVSIWVTLLQFDIPNYLAMCLLEVHNYLENTSVLVKKKKKLISIFEFVFFFPLIIYIWDYHIFLTHHEQNAYTPSHFSSPNKINIGANT